MKGRTIWLAIGAILLNSAYFLYRMLLPTGPVTDELPSSIVDKSSGLTDESNIEHNPLKEAYFGDLHIHTVSHWTPILY